MGTMTVVVTPEGAFMKGPQGTMPLPESQREDMLKEIRRDLLALLKMRKDSSFRAIATGTETVEGMKVEKVSIELMGDSTVLGIDPDSGHIVMMTFRGKKPMAGTPGEVVRTFTDFRDIDGLMIPFKTASTFEETVAT